MSFLHISNMKIWFCQLQSFLGVGIYPNHVWSWAQNPEFNSSIIGHFDTISIFYFAIHWIYVTTNGSRDAPPTHMLQITPAAKAQKLDFAHAALRQKQRTPRGTSRADGGVVLVPSPNHPPKLYNEATMATYDIQIATYRSYLWIWRPLRIWNHTILWFKL